MKHSIFALPALLRPAYFIAAASQSSFSVQDDLLAFPQYEVNFSDEYVLESQVQARLNRNEHSSDDAPSHLEQYRPPDQSLTGDSKTADEVKVEYESLLLEGQRYLCSIPQIKKPEATPGGNETRSKADEEKELARATDRGWELLQGMQGNCVYFISGWWSYKFCYNDGVRQFHQLHPSKDVPVFPPMEDPAVEGFTLGTYNPSEKDGASSKKQATQESGLDVSERAKTTTKTSAVGELVQQGESRYLVQRLDGGTKCDLTGRDRRIDVQFHCNPSSGDRISLIKETSTCTYLMVIQTPRLCHDVAFLPPQKDEPNAIICSPILTEDEVEDYNESLKILKKAEQNAKLREATAEAAKIFQGREPPQIVGDIEVGGHALVPEDLKLEKSAIVGGGKETYIDTVASSDGKVVSKEDLEKLGLGDPQAVEELKKKLQKIAVDYGVQEWKLDVIDTPRGREYRGIIGTNEDAESESKKKDDGNGDAEKSKDDGEEEKGSKEEYYHEEL